MAEFFSMYLTVIILAVLGLGFLVAEMFLPGFGLPGITGALLELASVYVSYASHGFVTALVVLIILLLLDALCLSVALHSIRKGKLSKSNIVLKDEETADDEVGANDEMLIFLGQKGKTITAMRPVGIIELNGVRLNASTQGEFLDKDAGIEVIRVEGKRLFVSKVKE